MTIGKLYKLCLKRFFQSKTILLDQIDFIRLPRVCVKDFLVFFSPIELERFDEIFREKFISTDEIWRRHFDLIWSLSRDDKERFQSTFDIPYKRLYFEYLFHDTEILQLTIYTEVHPKSIVDISLYEKVSFDLNRDSIVYSSKKRFETERENFVIRWNQRWNRYIERLILVPNVLNFSQLDPSFIETFGDHLRSLVLSGFPIEHDVDGMKIILTLIKNRRIENLVLKFPSYSLLNIILPCLICPRSFRLNFVLFADENQQQRKSSRQIHVQIDEPSANDDDSLASIEQLIPFLNRPNLFKRFVSRSEPSMSERSSDAICSNNVRIDDVFTNIRATDSIIFQLDPSTQFDFLTNLAFCYISSIDVIEMIGFALREMHQIKGLTLINLSHYSLTLEKSLISLCVEQQLKSLHLTSLTLSHGAIGFLIDIFKLRSNRKTRLTSLRFDTIRWNASSIIASEFDRIQWSNDILLEAFIWREREMNSNHFHLLHRFIPDVCSRLQRLELNSVFECDMLDKMDIFQRFVVGIRDVRLRNFRFRSENVYSLLKIMSNERMLSVFHLERIGSHWNDDQFFDRSLSSFIVESKHLIELSLAYNNFSDALLYCFSRLLSYEKNDSFWSIVHLNLNFNLISIQSLRTFLSAIELYQHRSQFKRIPLKRIELFGNEINHQDISTLKIQFEQFGCILHV